MRRASSSFGRVWRFPTSGNYSLRPCSRPLSFTKSSYHVFNSASSPPPSTTNFLMTKGWLLGGVGALGVIGLGVHFYFSSNLAVDDTLLPAKDKNNTQPERIPANTPSQHDSPPSASLDKVNLPVESAQLTFAPNVPPPITRHTPAIVQANFTVLNKRLPVDPIYKYDWWTFNGQVPGPMIRARVGDVLEVTLTNKDESGMLHNIDFHAVIGPGGGAALLTPDTDQTKAARFRLAHPGIFIYHCSVEPIAVHISNGMFGLILVEPEGGLPPVDREFYVMQSEVYTSDEPMEGTRDVKELSLENALISNPQYVVFNGRADSMLPLDSTMTTEESAHGPLEVKTSDTVRIFFGNAGPNLFSACHIIGAILNVWRDGDVLSPPVTLQTTTVAPGSAAVLEFRPTVPGTYTLVDHAIIRTEKGAVAHINADGPLRPDLYFSEERPQPCPECKIHV